MFDRLYVTGRAAGVVFFLAPICCRALYALHAGLAEPG